MRRRMLLAEFDRVVGDGLIARGIGGIDRIAFEQVAAVMIDVRGVGHASPPFGLRGARGFGGAFSAFFVAGVFAFEAVVAFAPSRLVFAAFRLAFAPAPVSNGLSVVFGVGGGAALARSEERRVGKGCVRTCRSGWLTSH